MSGLTFQQLGIGFPLFEAPIERNSNYVGAGRCILLNRNVDHCFRMGIGDALIFKCQRCSTPNALDAHDRKDVACRLCGETIRFPASPDHDVLISYEMLRAGHASMTKDTEIGMLTHENLWTDLWMAKEDFDLPPGEDKVLAIDGSGEHVGDFDRVQPAKSSRIEQEDIEELLRTPNYSTWQGEKWLFNGGHPMTFIGEWQAKDFIQNAGERNPDEFVSEVLGGFPEELNRGVADWGRTSICFYIFRDRTTGIYRGHYDYD